LQNALEFKECCVKIYKKHNPNAGVLQQPIPAVSATEITEMVDEQEYFILEENNDLPIDDDSEFINESGGTEEDFTVFKLETINNTPKVKAPPKTPKRASNTSQGVKRKYKDISSVSIQETSDNDAVKASAKGRKSYSLQEKLEIIEYSEKFSNREASRQFQVNESTVRCFKRQKDNLLKMSPKKSTNRRGTPYWPSLELKLKEWADQQKKRPKIN
jgi:hypothetical protein